MFIGQRDDAPISRNTIHDQCDRVTEGRASPHGWRATFRSWCSTTGVDFEVSEACLAHAKSAVVAAYDRADMVERRRATMERWAQFLSGEDAETNVVTFPKRA